MRALELRRSASQMRGRIGLIRQSLRTRCPRLQLNTSTTPETSVVKGEQDVGRLRPFTARLD